jgi:hypothetical protein
MRRFSFSVLLSAVMVLVVLASPIATMAQKGAPVVVTNTAATPVPVSGNVNAAVTGSVNANVTNTVPVQVNGTANVSGAVSITGTPSVNPSNTSLAPLFLRDVDNPANEPFEWEDSSSDPVSGFTVFLDVPSTTADGRTVKRLVIEEVSIKCKSLSNPSAGAMLSAFDVCFSHAGTCSTNASLFHLIPFQAANPDPTLTVSSQLVRVYADPKVFITLSLLTTQSAGTCDYAALGHYIVE